MKLEDFIGKRVSIHNTTSGIVNISRGILKQERGSWVLREENCYLNFGANVPYYFDDIYYQETGTAYFYLNPDENVI